MGLGVLDDERVEMIVEDGVYGETQLAVTFDLHVFFPASTGILAKRRFVYASTTKVAR